MSVEVLGASHLASEGWEVQRTNNFELTVSGVGETNRLLTLSVDSAFLPDENNEEIQLHYGNTLIKVAGKYNVQSGTIAVKDIIQQDVERMIEEWRSTVFNKETDAVGLAFNYKKQGRIVQYAPDGTMERTWKLEGLWPQSVRYGDLSYNGSQAKSIQLTLSYDKAVMVRE